MRIRKASTPGLWILVACLLLPGSGSAYAAETGGLNQLLTDHLTSKDSSPRFAPDGQLARRIAIDLTGVVPSLTDLVNTEGMTPAEMFDYFAGKDPMPHTAGEQPYVWVNLLQDADHFLFSNSFQFSQAAHIREFRDVLARMYREGSSYREFARWAMRSQMFPNRFPSGADRANAVFFLFLGRDSLASEVSCGNMWNGYRLENPRIPVQEFETNPDWHAYIYDPQRCADGRALCEAELWSRTGSTPTEAIEMIVGSPLFSEAVVDRYWARYIGEPLPGLDFPRIRKVLAQGFIDADYDPNWVIREIVTSIAYTQEAMFR